MATILFTESCVPPRRRSSSATLDGQSCSPNTTARKHRVERIEVRSLHCGLGASVFTDLRAPSAARRRLAASMTRSVWRSARCHTGESSSTGRGARHHRAYLRTRRRAGGPSRCSSRAPWDLNVADPLVFEIEQQQLKGVPHRWRLFRAGWMTEISDVRYARSGDVSIAYQVVGDGPLDLVFVRGITGDSSRPGSSPCSRDTSSGSPRTARLMLLDKRGTGLSDRVASVPTLETRMDDVRAVMDAVGSERGRPVERDGGQPDDDAVRRHLSRTRPSRWSP